MLGTEITQEGASPHEAVMAEMKGLREVMDTRFDAVTREQDSSREWMGRISTAMDRVSETLSRQIHIEARVAHAESDISDLKLDLSEAQKELTDQKEKSIKGGLILNGIVGFASAAATAFGMKFLGLAGK
jgi:chromosome condensin MukBEF ATPase and DNA-binding subunit MukB